MSIGMRWKNEGRGLAILHFVKQGGSALLGVAQLHRS